MVALATVLAVMLVSLLISRIATIALTLPGLSRDAARFQARSALSGTGFTTTEAESVVNHPVRRQIAMLLMLVGSAGLVTVIASLMLSFAGTRSGQVELRLAVLLTGLAALWWLSRSSRVDRWLSSLIARGLTRWTQLDARDYGALLHLADRYAVGELLVRPGDWLAGRTVEELELRDEGVVLLGITLPDGTWLGSPTFGARIGEGDRLVVYAPAARIAELDRRPAGPEGDEAHRTATAEHRSLTERLEREHPRD